MTATVDSLYHFEHGLWCIDDNIGPRRSGMPCPVDTVSGWPLRCTAILRRTLSLPSESLELCPGAVPTQQNPVTLSLIPKSPGVYISPNLWTLEQAHGFENY